MAFLSSPLEDKQFPMNIWPGPHIYHQNQNVSHTEPIVVY